MDFIKIWLTTFCFKTSSSFCHLIISGIRITNIFKFLQYSTFFMIYGRFRIWYIDHGFGVPSCLYKIAYNFKTTQDFEELFPFFECADIPCFKNSYFDSEIWRLTFVHHWKFSQNLAKNFLFETSSFICHLIENQIQITTIVSFPILSISFAIYGTFSF